MTPLPDTDAANYIALPSDKRWDALKRFRNSKNFTVNYTPVRRHLAGLLGLSTGMFGPPPVDPKVQLEQLERDCVIKTDIDVRSNLAVAKGVLRFADDRLVTGRSLPPIHPRTIGGEQIACWNSLVMSLDGGRPVIPFVDPRRSSRLTPEGRRVALSLMHENIREMDPDFAVARLAIMQFADAKSSVRTCSIHFDDDVVLMPLDELELRVKETFEMWAVVCTDRERDARSMADEADDLPMDRIWRAEAS